MWNSTAKINVTRHDSKQTLDFPTSILPAGKFSMPSLLPTSIAMSFGSQLINIPSFN